jgi:excisionase family DNA binding protein
MTLDAALAAVVAEAVAPLAEKIERLTAIVDALRDVSPPMLVSVQEFCRRAGISPATAWRMIASKELPVQRIGRSVRINLAALRPIDPGEIARLSMEARQ